jgi:hypothetical protein
LRLELLKQRLGKVMMAVFDATNQQFPVIRVKVLKPFNTLE